MKLTQAQFDQAYQELIRKYEPIKQHEFVYELLKILQETIKRESGFPFTTIVLSTEQLREFKRITDETVKIYIEQSPYRSILMKDERPIFEINIERISPDTIEFVYDNLLQRLRVGTAPLKFFNPTQSEVEEFWEKEFQEKNTIRSSPVKAYGECDMTVQAMQMRELYETNPERYNEILNQTPSSEIETPSQVEEKKKIQISVEEIKTLRDRIREINALSFDEVEWTENSIPLTVNEDFKKNWKYTGLNTIDYIFYDYYKEDNSNDTA